MAQIPVSDDTYCRITLFKARAVIAKEGGSVIWDDVISAMIDTCNIQQETFIEAVKKKAGKVRRSDEMIKQDELDSVAKVKEALEEGKSVTSEQLESANKVTRLKE